MSKTKTKLSTEVTEIHKVDPRKAMKVVRSEVKHAVKHGVRVDQLGHHGADIPRVIISLQDQLTDTQARHRKATNHIAALVGNLEFLDDMATATIEIQALYMQTLEKRNQELLKRVSLLEGECDRLVDGWQAANHEIDQLSAQVDASRLLLKAEFNG
jgi:hypothetical protein